ncbi:hypothetical protein P8452_28170 [Trifolium repens]|nr:hypothetical protein P8452_28170 [Trifolium repens]
MALLFLLLTQDLKTKEPLLQGLHRDDLYHLPPPSNNHKAFLTATSIALIIKPENFLEVNSLISHRRPATLRPSTCRRLPPFTAPVCFTALPTATYPAFASFTIAYPVAASSATAYPAAAELGIFFLDI